jgi:hypothetical protein
MLPDTKTVLGAIEISCTAAATNFAAIDTKGWDFLELDVVAGTGSAAETALTALRCGHSDTAPTDVTTDTTAIPAFTGAAATSTSAGFVLPALSSTKLNTYRFNVDLRGRKRYIACEMINTTVINAGCAFVGRLSRRESAEAMGTVATSVDGCRLVASG